MLKKISAFFKSILFLGTLLFFFSLNLGCGKSQDKAVSAESHKVKVKVTAQDSKAALKERKPLEAISRKPKAALERQRLVEIINRDPEAWKERYMLGGLYLKEDDFQSARERFLEVIKIKPDFAKGYSGLAMCSMRLNELDKALEYWKLVRKYDPKNRAARDFIYRIERKLKVDRKISALAEKVEKRRADWKDKKKLGETYLNKRRFSQAAEMFEQALKSNPRDPDLNYQLAKAYLNTRQYDKASRFFSRASRLAPGNGQYALMARRIRQVMANLRKRKKRQKKGDNTGINKQKKQPSNP